MERAVVICRKHDQIYNDKEGEPEERRAWRTGTDSAFTALEELAQRGEISIQDTCGPRCPATVPILIAVASGGGESIPVATGTRQDSS